MFTFVNLVSFSRCWLLLIMRFHSQSDNNSSWCNSWYNHHDWAFEIKFEVVYLSHDFLFTWLWRLSIAINWHLMLCLCLCIKITIICIIAWEEEWISCTQWFLIHCLREIESEKSDVLRVGFWERKNDAKETREFMTCFIPTYSRAPLVLWVKLSNLSIQLIQWIGILLAFVSWKKWWANVYQMILLFRHAWTRVNNKNEMGVCISLWQMQQSRKNREEEEEEVIRERDASQDVNFFSQNFSFIKNDNH